VLEDAQLLRAYHAADLGTILVTLGLVSGTHALYEHHIVRNLAVAGLEDFSACRARSVAKALELKVRDDVRILAVTVFGIFRRIKYIAAGGHNYGPHFQLTDYIVLGEIDGAGTALSNAFPALAAKTAGEAPLALFHGHLSREAQLYLVEGLRTRIRREYGHLMPRNRIRACSFLFSQLYRNRRLFRRNLSESAVFQVTVDRHGRLSPVSHSLNEGGWSEHSIASGKHPGAVSGQGFLVDSDFTARSQLETQLGKQFAFRSLADGHKYRIAGQRRQLVLIVLRVEPLVFVKDRCATLEFHARDFAVVTCKFFGTPRIMDGDAFLKCFVNFPFPSRHLVAGFQADQVNLRRARAKGSAGYVYCDVSAADNHHIFAYLDFFSEACLPQHIHAADNAFKVFSLDSQAPADVQTGGDIDRLEALVL